MTASGVFHFVILKMKHRLRKLVESANVVIMQVRENHRLDRLGVYTQ